MAQKVRTSRQHESRLEERGLGTARELVEHVVYEFSTSPLSMFYEPLVRTLMAGGAVVAEDDIAHQMGAMDSKAANGDTRSSHVGID